MAVTAAACSGSDSTTAETVAPAPVAVVTEAPIETTPVEPTEESAAPVSAADTSEAPPTASASPSAAFPDLAPPTGEELVIGLVNSEGTPGLDFPEIRVYIEASVDYLNLHGGMGGRPVKIESCTVKGSPETSQACAQELVGKKVEMVMLGLDLFPDYATYTAANIPVIGVLPILPGDYTANALFLTGGNATTTAAMAAAAKLHYKAETVGIVSSDNPGANGTEAALTAALDLAGIAHVTVKGGDDETDAGYQGLMREAAKDNPDLLISLYSDAGCIGTIRGRAALGIQIPTMTTAICSGKAVLDEVGDDALGWSFVGVQTQEDTPELAILQTMLAPALGVEPEAVDSTALGLGALGVIEIMSLAQYSNMMQANGEAVTGESLFAFLGSAKDLTQWPSGSVISCGAAPKYPAICSLTFPIAEYTAGGEVITIPGLEAVSVVDFLP
jgi:ABC-type branched-subunit amino acid transport system substrate-binding protein